MGKSIPKEIQLKIWRRDRWTCRYCKSPVFFAPTLKLLDKMNPGHGYYHPHGKTGEMLSLFQWSWASVDHIVPKSKGGTDSIDNYVTACWGCNLRLGDKPQEKDKPKPITITGDIKKIEWDGLSSLYPKLSEKEDEWTRLIKLI